jgi:hypothetical protein
MAPLASRLRRETWQALLAPARSRITSSTFIQHLMVNLQVVSKHSTYGSRDLHQTPTQIAHYGSCNLPRDQFELC